MLFLGDIFTSPLKTIMKKQLMTLAIVLLWSIQTFAQSSEQTIEINRVGR
jgi:hypothetical protein